MDRYKIPCTQEQTRKALELGAPIETVGKKDNRLSIQNGFVFAIIPTAEEMIGWLEEQKIIITIEIGTDCWHSRVSNPEIYIKRIQKPTRQETTIAAIDAALEYLTDNSLIK